MSQKTLLVLVCALVLIFTGAQLIAQNPIGQAASQAGNAASQVGSAASQAGKAASQAGKDAASQVGNAASQTGNAASQAADAASQTGKDAASQAGDAASQAGNAAADAADPGTKAKVEAKLQQISTELNLTDEQKTQIKPVLQDEFTQLKGVRNDSSMSPEQKKAKATEIHQSAKSQISSFLTPEQQKKLAEMRETARDK